MTEPSPRRWLVITSSFPRHDQDLAGHFVQEWCRSLANRGHTIDVLAWRGSQAQDRQICPNLTVRFVPYAWPRAERLFYGAGAPENLTDSPLTRLLAIPAAASMAATAVNACRHTNYDAVIGHWLVPGGLLARFIGRLTGLDSFVVGHSGGVHILDNLPTPLGQAIARMVTAGPTTIATRPLQNKLLNLTRISAQCAQVAPMGYTSRHQQNPASNKVPDTLQPPCVDHIFRLGFLGRLVPIKGLPTVLRALERLQNDGVALTLDVVGDGPSRSTWESQAPTCVDFHGPRYGDEKWAALTSWHASITPSEPLQNGRHEGLPVSLLEAASVGTIPLVSGVPGVEDWLARPAHQIVPAGDISQWCRTIAWLARLPIDDRKSLADESRRCVSELEWSTYSQYWEPWLITSEPIPEIGK